MADFQRTISGSPYIYPPSSLKQWWKENNNGRFPSLFTKPPFLERFPIILLFLPFPSYPPTPRLLHFRSYFKILARDKWEVLLQLLLKFLEAVQEKNKKNLPTPTDFDTKKGKTLWSFLRNTAIIMLVYCSKCSLYVVRWRNCADPCHC